MKTIYLACAYSYHSRIPLVARLVMWYRTRRITKVAAKIMMRNINVFSPITHSHHIAVTGRLPQLDHEFWLRLDKWYVDRCDEIWVYSDSNLDWLDSKGVDREISWGLDARTPIFKVNDEGFTHGRIF